MNRRARVRVQRTLRGRSPRVGTGDSIVTGDGVHESAADRPTVTTPRLRLEPLAAHHAEGIWKAVQASLPELKRWMAWARSASPEAQKEFVLEAESAWGKDGWIFAIVNDGEIIGTIGIDRYQPLLASAEVGYWLRSDCSGRGFMTEAAAAAVRFAFLELGLHRLELHAGLDNKASIRIAEKLGFSRRGILRDGAMNAWHHYDVEVFDLLETDPLPDVGGAQAAEGA